MLSVISERSKILRGRSRAGHEGLRDSNDIILILFNAHVLRSRQRFLTQPIIPLPHYNLDMHYRESTHYSNAC